MRELCERIFDGQTALASGASDRKVVWVQVPSPAPNKNESYDTIGIATFVLFPFAKTLVS